MPPATATYLLLIHEPVGQRAERLRSGGEAAGRAAYAAMSEFAQDLERRGVLRGVNSLAPQHRGTRVQVRDGQARMIDGPFAEAKEMVGGYFLIEGVTREQALEIAARCPAAAFATVEVRPVAPCYET